MDEADIARIIGRSISGTFTTMERVNATGKLNRRGIIVEWVDVTVFPAPAGSSWAFGTYAHERNLDD